jgi:hypothetical protein
MFQWTYDEARDGAGMWLTLGQNTDDIVRGLRLAILAREHLKEEDTYKAL